MELNKNPIKLALINGQTVFGLNIGIPSPVIVELAAYAGFDFIRIDTSHNSYDLPTITNLIRAAEAVGITPMARVDNDPYMITNILEAGAMGLIIPDVSTAEIAKEVVKAVHFTPLGDRGTYSAARVMQYGRIGGGDYVRWSNEELLLGVQIESKEAADNLEDILKVEGIDLIGSGRGDLSNSLGMPGQMNHPAVMALEDTIFEMAKSCGKFTSVNLNPTASDFAETVGLWKKKAQVITLGHDVPFIRKMFSEAIVTARNN
jgi:4-hydroxy-2-oxoheptanedioate aldolase